MEFRLLPKSVTLNDLERRNDARYLCGSLALLRYSDANVFVEETRVTSEIRLTGGTDDTNSNIFVDESENSVVNFCTAVDVIVRSLQHQNTGFWSHRKLVITEL